MKTWKCRNCGKTFNTTKTKVYCSPECFHEFVYTQKECKLCGKRFDVKKVLVKHRQYCSAECRETDLAARKGSNRRTFTCRQCGEEFIRPVSPSSLKRTTFEFCSPICRNKARTKEPIRKICPVCKNHFIERTHSGPNKPKYCSRECANTASLGRQSPKKTRREIIEFIRSHYPTNGADWTSKRLGLSIGSVRQIAEKNRILITKEAKQRLIYDVSRRRMKENNPMKDPVVVKKVANYRAQHSEYFLEIAINASAKNQRNNPSRPEIKCCGILTDLGIVFERQVIIKPKFIVDFVIGNLVLQVDGEYWHGHPRFEPLTERQQKQRARDKAQDKYLTTCGYKIARIWESEINHGHISDILKQYSVIH